MKFPAVFFSVVLLSAVFFGACASVDYVQITGGSEPERVFIENLFRENPGFETHKLRLLTAEHESDGTPPASLYIDIVSSWEYEGNYGDIVISRIFYAPRTDPLAARTNTSLTACLDGTEDVVPVAEIMPPFTALRVDNRALGDQGYPLVRTTGIRIRMVETEKPVKHLDKKISFITKALEDTPKTLLYPPPQPLWIAAGGDLMLDRGASEILFKEGPAGIFGETAAMLESADLALVNLEGVISTQGEKTPKSFNFRFVPEVAAALKNAGIDAVLHANNHVFDYGETAFLDSLSWLAKAEIGIAGAGNDDEEASDPAVFQRGDVECRVFGLASFPRERNGWDGASAAAGTNQPGMLHAEKGGKEKLIGKLSSTETTVLDIVLFHGGVEWSIRPDAATRTLYTDLINAGADLVIGSHPHVVQGFEWVQGKPVFWSLGNYVFGGMGNTSGGEEGLFLHLGFLDGRLLYMEPFALALNHTRTIIAPPEKLETFYRRSRELSGQGTQR